MTAGANAGLRVARPGFAELLLQVEHLGETVVAPAGVAVDRDARFPAEAFAAFRTARLLSAYIPVEFGGLGLGIAEICRICETLGRYCASTAMVYAMHQIQVACIVHHGRDSVWMKNFLRRICDEQLLLADRKSVV